MKTLIAGEWVSGELSMPVVSPFTGETIDTVPQATESDVQRALAAAERGAAAMAQLPAHRRSEILHGAANSIELELDELASTISAEQGKPLSEARLEAARTPPLLRLCAEEAVRIYGEVLPMDAHDFGVGTLGFTLKEPSGVVLAITPFNFPSRLVGFKVGPALAAGNAVILKPASATPLTALILARHLFAAGLPPLALQVVCGPGATVGEALVSDRRIRKVSFTGSVSVGQQIARAAGLKRVTCELGSNVGVIVLDDADLERAAEAVSIDGFFNGGQVCISAQRIIVDERVHDEFVSLLLPKVDRHELGDPASSTTTIGPLINEREASRVVDWLDEARGKGAAIVRGGGRDGTLVEPAVVLDTPLEAQIWGEELFGPAVALHKVSGPDEACAVANKTRYGLAASVFTRDVDRFVDFSRGLRTGLVHVNNGPNWRADFMPYGGYGDSGFGKEGVRYSIEEMTETKMVVLHPNEKSEQR